MIKQRAKKHGHNGVYDCGGGKVHGEPDTGLGEKNAAREQHDALVQTEEDDRKSKTRGGVFGVQPRSDGGRQITDDRFGNAVKTQRNSGPAKTVLKQPDDHAQQETGGRVATAEAKINGNQQRQIDHRGFRKINGHESLKHQGEEGGADNRSAAKLVHLDVRLHIANIEGVVHSGFAVEAALAVAGTGAGVTGAESGFGAVPPAGDFAVSATGLLGPLADGFAVSVS